jgi:CheY-like chemotaxis protein
VADSLPPAPAAKASVAAAASGAVRRVLLVDDEDAVRRITARALSKHGWQVLEAESAETALILLDADPQIALTVLVSDVVMPGKHGAALVEEVRARYPALPAILVSGYSQGLLGEPPAAAVFLGKPYSPNTLLARLQEIAPETAPCVARQPSPTP